MDNATPTFDTQRYVVVFVTQLVLVAVAVLMSRLEEGARLGLFAVMAATVANGIVVALFLMGVVREGRPVKWLAVAVLVFALGLLVWPAWDVYERVRVF